MGICIIVMCVIWGMLRWGVSVSLVGHLVRVARVIRIVVILVLMGIT